MTTQTEDEKRQDGADRYNPFDVVFGDRAGTTALDWAMVGCLVAGVVGIIKAFSMSNASGVLLCLLGSVAAFGLVVYVHFRKG